MMEGAMSALIDLLTKDVVSDETRRWTASFFRRLLEIEEANKAAQHGVPLVARENLTFDKTVDESIDKHESGISTIDTRRDTANGH
jgi:hypothetical protein